MTQAVQIWVAVDEVMRTGVNEAMRFSVYDVTRLHIGSLHTRFPKLLLNSHEYRPR